MKENLHQPRALQVRALSASLVAPAPQDGLSLTELMVALAISAMIMIGLVQIFQSSRATYQYDEGMSRLQENGRFALDFLSRDARMAGYMGCLGNIPETQQDLDRRVVNYLAGSGGSAIFDLSRGGVEGFDFNGTSPGDTYVLPSLYPTAPLATNTTPALNPALVPNAVSGSDVLVLRLMEPDAVTLVPPYNDGAQVFVSTPNSLKQNDILIVTDCERVSIFQATTVSATGDNIAHGNGGNPGNICSNWDAPGCKGKDYKEGAQISRFKIVAYFIGQSANGGPALFRRTWDNGIAQPIELVEGVENMQILYGVDTDRDMPPTGNWFNADRYVPASAVAGLGGWSRVVSIRIALLVSGRVSATTTGETITMETDTSNYGVGGVTVNPVDDRRQRRVFTSTIEIRNR